jgi:hypothetical protein
MRSRSVRTLIVILSVLLVATAMQLALLASPAAADEPSLLECTYAGRRINELRRGTIIRWECRKKGENIWYWKQLNMDPGGSSSALREFSSNGPPYLSFVNSGIGHGTTNGVAVASYSLRYPNGSELNRRIAVRLEIHNRSTGVRCVNGVWHETYASRITWEAFINLPANCGSGYYETAVHARFWSESLNRWIDNYWTRSGQLYFSANTLQQPATNRRPS